ncbi:MAG: type II toxin-antitoxin system RelE/ParE family toxin [Slackia faecicanis]|nr:type II toxin-antitoxin system RelE/ParE family toxin [Slackia faecicanis]
MAYECVVLEGARREVEDIVDYLLAVSDGPSAAASFLDAFEAFLREVGENPSLHAFSRLPEIAALGYRSAVVGRYVALYFERNGRVYVAHVFHQRRDYARLV